MPNLKDTRYQILATLITRSVSTLAGVNLAFATLVFPKLLQIDESPDSQTHNATVHVTNRTLDILQIDKEQASWVASLSPIAVPLGAVLVGALMDRYGRKRMVIATNFIFGISWIITGLTSSHIAQLYVGRFLSGLAMGFCLSAGVYVAEISHPSIRPLLLTGLSVYTSLGILMGTILDRVLTWRHGAFTYAGLSFVCMCLMFLLPETPLWLSRNGANEQDVKRSLRFFNRTEQHFNEEFQRLRSRQNCQSEFLMSAGKKTPQDTRNKKRFWKPILILTVLVTFQQLSGAYTVILYALQIFESISSLDVDGWTCLVILGVIRFVMALVAAMFPIGRRKLLLTGGSSMAFTIFLAGISLICGFKSIVALTFVMGYVMSSAFSYMVVPWGLVSELLPDEIRGRGTGAIISFAYFLMFIAAKCYFTMEKEIGLPNMFLIFGAITAGSVVFIYFYIPETLGKTFVEIEKEINR